MATLLLTGILFGFVLPALFSAQSDEALWAGIILILLIPLVYCLLYKLWKNKIPLKPKGITDEKHN